MCFRTHTPVGSKSIKRLLNCFRLKGDRNARDKADNTGPAFAERMRSHAWCQRLDRTCASTAGLCASSYTAAAAGL